MNKLYKILFSLLLCCTSFAAPFSGATNIAHANQVVASPMATSSWSSLEHILTNCSITQDGYKFTKEDFEETTATNPDQSQTTVFNLYVNTSITFTIDTVNSSNTTLLVGHKQSTHDAYTYSDVLKSATGSINSYTLAYTDSTQEVVHNVELSHWDNTANKESNFFFNLIQTPVNFSNKKPYNWKTTGGLNDSTVISPSDVAPYEKYLTLDIDSSGTINSPIYIDFYFNGEFYSVYKIGNTYYNNITNNPLKEATLSFNIPGQYEVYIYDKTCTSILQQMSTKFQNSTQTYKYKMLNKQKTKPSSYSNCNSFKFSVQDETSPYNTYLIATDNSGKTLVNNQVVNSAVSFKFYNLDPLNISKIEVLKYHSSITGTNMPTSEYLVSENISDNPTFNGVSALSATTVTYSADNSYTINIYDASGQAIWEQSFVITILTDIHNSYYNLSSTDRNLVPEDNKVEPIPQTEYHETSYKGFNELVGENEYQNLKSSSASNFIVQLARANCSIDGMDFKKASYEPVTLAIHGVGNIKVTIYRDNALADTITLTDGRTVTQSQPGKYKITIVDEMGTTLTKTFTIRQPLNGATIALIVIGAIALAIFIFLIIRTRTKIKVR